MALEQCRVAERGREGCRPPECVAATEQRDATAEACKENGL